MDASLTAQAQDLTSCRCCSDNTNSSSPPLSESDHVVEDNCCGGDELKHGKCGGSDENANKDSCNGIEGSDVGDEKNGCGGLDSVASLPVVDCCDKEASKQGLKSIDGELVSLLRCSSL